MCKKMTGVGLAVSCAIGILLLFQMGLAASRSDQQKQANADLSLLEITSEKITIEFHPPDGTSGALEVELYQLDGQPAAGVGQASGKGNAKTPGPAASN